MHFATNVFFLLFTWGLNLPQLVLIIILLDLHEYFFLPRCLIIQNTLIYLWRIFAYAFYVLIEKFSLLWRRQHYRWRAANFDLNSAFMAFEQWGFFSVIHLLWHRTSVYNGHIRGPATLAPVAKRLQMEMSLPILTTLVCHDWESNPDLPKAYRYHITTLCLSTLCHEKQVIWTY